MTDRFSPARFPTRLRAALLGLAVGPALVLGGCAGDPEASQVLGKSLGAGVGAVAGGYLGNKIGTGTANTIATTVGVAMGAYFGGRLFDRLARGDLDLAEAAQTEALERAPSGRMVAWSNPDTGASGTATAQPAVERDGQGPCRPFTHLVRHEGENETFEGVACRAADGSWQVVEGGAK
jgi:surface antigen